MHTGAQKIELPKLGQLYSWLSGKTGYFDSGVTGRYERIASGQVRKEYTVKYQLCADSRRNLPPIKH